MRNARLIAITVERFKSFETETRIELAPLTVVLGRNNSGKSTLIQSLLLLKQTLTDVRPDVRLRLDGMVDALNLRELTYGWPSDPGDPEARFIGPTIAVEWDCEVNVAEIEQLQGVDATNLAKMSGVTWLESPPEWKPLRTKLTLYTEAIGDVSVVSKVVLESTADNVSTKLEVSENKDGTVCTWNGKTSKKMDVEFEHFIPYLHIDRGKLGPRDSVRAWYNAYLVVFAEPLKELRKILSEMHYLGSSRPLPVSLYKATAAPNELGVSGEHAASLLHRRQRDMVHFLPLLSVSDSGLVIPSEVRALPLVDAVNETLASLSVKAPVRIELHTFGFRLMFGDASLVHVGRGLGYLLPLVALGLFADPLRFSEPNEELPLAVYQDRCAAFTHIALEEPEAHLHPKVASRLAHWLVSLAMSNRRLIVETHSDHLVRRLRGLVARAGNGSFFERWLLDNVRILSVEQDESGRSSVSSSRLTAEGGVSEVWPADFMDEATDEESAIYYAKLDKCQPAHRSENIVEMVEGPEPELDQSP